MVDFFSLTLIWRTKFDHLFLSCVNYILHQQRMMVITIGDDLPLNTKWTLLLTRFDFHKGVENVF